MSKGGSTSKIGDEKMKDLAKALIITIVTLLGLLLGGIVFLDKNEAWLYDRFGKKEVRSFMKRFEPLIVMTEDAEEVLKSVKDESIDALHSLNKKKVK